MVVYVAAGLSTPGANTKTADLNANMRGFQRSIPIRRQGKDYSNSKR
jgi:hypothetical protein